MTEYRVIATLDIECKEYKRHFEKHLCWFDGRAQKMETFEKDKAIAFLLKAKEECPKFDAITAERFSKDKNAVKYTHSNIRIETRKVSSWS